MDEAINGQEFCIVDHSPDCYSTGSLGLDIALGIGGIPSGAIVEINAPAGSGKTTLTYHLIAEAQKLRGYCAFIDADRAFDCNLARRCGVQLELLYYSQPEHAEQAFDIIETLSGSGAFSVIVLDSLNSLVTYQELAGPWRALTTQTDEDLLDIDSALLAGSLRRLSSMLRRCGVSVVFTNQATSGMSAIYHQLAEHPARMALKLQASIRLRLMSVANLLSDARGSGLRIRARVIKNKYFPCLQSVDFDIIYHQGINKTGEVIDLGVHYQLVQKTETGFFYKSTRLGKTVHEVASNLNRDLSLRDDIEQALRRLLIPNIQPAVREIN